MNTVLVTSAVYSNYGVYSAQERIQQTLATVESARKYIPDSVIILIDNSKVDVQQDDSIEFNALIDAVDYYIDNSDDADIQHFHNHVANYDVGKNSMEVLGMIKSLSYITSDSELMGKITSSNRIFKLSGRYLVTEQFDITAFDNDTTQNKFVFKQAQPGWIKDIGTDTLLQTRLYSFTPSMLFDVINLFQTIINNMFSIFNQQKYIDVEHSMSLFIPKEKLVELPIVGLKGNIAPNGQEVID
jgi:hypothetical protein